MDEFWLCFVPLFVAVDAVGVLPMFLSLTDGLGRERRRRVVVQSVLTAGAVALGFLFLGDYILRFLGITVADFMVAGGVLLFVISLTDILALGDRKQVTDLDSLGAVPIGVPLIAGPAVLTTSILLLREYGIVPTVASVTVNILLAGLVFWGADRIYGLVGKAGAKTISKLAALLLAAIAVKMVRKGLLSF